AAAARQSAVQAEERPADVALRRSDLGQPRGALPQRLRQRAARASRREAAVGGPGAGGTGRLAGRQIKPTTSLVDGYSVVRSPASLISGPHLATSSLWKRPS